MTTQLPAASAGASLCQGKRPSRRPLRRLAVMAMTIGKVPMIIVGSGPAGYTAATYAARANLSVRIVEKEVCGGLVNWTHTVENVPSYKSIHGMDLMTACREHVESLGVAIEEVFAVNQQVTNAVTIDRNDTTCIQLYARQT